MARRLPRNLLVVAAVSLLTDLSTEMGFPLLPVFLAALGAGGLAVGAMEGLAESVASFLKYYSGRWSDRLGRRKGLTIAGYATSAAMKLGFPVAAAAWHVVALRALDRVGKGIRSAPRDALIADSTPRERWGFAFGFHRAMDTLGAFLGPLIALGLVAAAYELSTIFLVAALPAILGVSILFLVRESGPASRTGATPPARVFANKPLFSYLLTIAVFTLGNLSIAFLLLRAAQVDLSTSEVLLIYLAYNATYALLAFPLGAVTDHIGRTPILALAMAAVAGGGLLVATQDPRTLAAFLPAALVFGFASAGWEGNGRALAADLASKELRGSVLGAYHATIGLAALPGGLLAGLLWDIDFRLAYVAGALLATAALAELLWLWYGGLGGRGAGGQPQPSQKNT